MRRQIDRLLAALVAAWVAMVCLTASADLREGPAYALVEHATPKALCPGETQRVEVTVENTGGRTWRKASGERLSYHWRDASGAVVTWDGRRADLEADVEPGAQQTLTAKVTAPTEPGRYQLVWRMLREGDDWFPEAKGSVAWVDVRGQGPPLAWSVEPFELPEISARGEARVDLTVTNEGCAAWSGATADRLSYRWLSPDGKTKRGEGLRTSFDAEVLPGASATVSLRLTGPNTPGRYLLRVAPVRERVAWMAAPVKGTADVHVEVRDAALQWAWTAAEIPDDVATGDAFEVAVQVRNTGTRTWDPALGDRLSYHWVRDGVRLDGEGRRTLLPRRVEPGESVLLRVAAVAPDEPGEVQFSLEPLRERIAWFGEPAESAFPRGGPTLDVASPPFVWRQLGVRVPKVPMAGRPTEFLLVVRNEGSRTWDPALGDRASYEVLDPSGTRVARGRRTDLPRRIEPGETVQLRVSFDTPREPGDYQIKFGLLREHVRWFEGETSLVPLRIVRRSSLWGVLALWVLAGWMLAMRSPRYRPWAVAAAWPAWVAVSTAVLTELFADLAQLQLFADGTPVALSVSAGLGAAVACVPRRWQARVSIPLVGLLSLVAWIDLAYANFFGSLAPLTAVAAIHHLVDAKATVGSTLRPAHAWLVAPWLSALVVHRADARSDDRVPRRVSVWIAALLVLLGGHAALTLITVARGSLGTRVFSEAHNARRFGYVGAHAFQALRLLRDWRAGPLSDEARAQVFARLDAVRASRPDEGHAVAQGANVVILQVEALQQWAVDAEVGGEAVMPFLSQAHSQALAYDRIYDQTSQGRTSDAEYLVLGSGHAMSEGALSFLRADNEFRTIVHALLDRGYASYSAHPYQRGFWNRSVLHPAYGFESSDFQAELGRGTRAGWGLADGPFLERFGERIAALPEPFVAFGITLSLHHPYESFPSSLATLEVGDLKGSWVANYLQAMRHFDASLQAWFADMQARGLLEHTVVLVYGDHVTGMPLDATVAELANETDDRYARMRMHRVPAFLWVPGSELKGRRSMVGGQIDLGVTALHVLGVEAPAAAVGTPLFGEGPGFAALPTGGAVGPQHMLVRRGPTTPTEGACVDPLSAKGLERETCDPLEARALEQLELARRILDHDLHRAAEQAR